MPDNTSSYEGQQEVAEAIEDLSPAQIPQRAVWFNTKAQMVAARFLPAGRTAAIRGNLTINDGGAGFYYVREKTEEDVASDTLIFLNNENVAELLHFDPINGEASYDGQQEIADAINGISQNMLQKSAFFYSNVAQMVQADLAVGNSAVTKGYSAVNDGGGSVYNIRAKVSGDTNNGTTIIFLDNGKVAELISKQPVVFATVAAMKAATGLFEGQTVMTQGSSSALDGSAAFYLVATKQSGDTESATLVFLNNGKVAKKITFS